MNFITTRTTKTSFSENMMITEIFDGLEINLQDVRENYEAAMKLANGEKFISLVIAAPFTSITKEAREEVNKTRMNKDTIAQAIVVKSLPNRLMGNFLVKFYKPSCPLKLFENKEDAITWLNEKWDKKTKAKISSTPSS